MGKRIVIELTNRCNLSCNHCFTGRHGGSDHLPVETLERVLTEARPFGFEQVAYTGGDPTVYRWFGDAVRLAAETGYRWGMVTNGWSFPRVYEEILPYRDSLDIVTFSLDGATPATHDRLRGAGSFKRVLRAFSVCAVAGFPFTINMVVTAHNQHEIEAMAALGERLGASGIRINHLMPSPITTAQGADLTPAERREVERVIAEVDGRTPIKVAMAPGFHTQDLFPCAPLNDREINIDVHGNLTKCCALSGHGPGAGAGDVAGDLATTSFSEAYERLRAMTERFRTAKADHFADDPADTDYFPCWYCTLSYDKVDWLAEVPGHPWGAIVSPAPNDARWEPMTLRGNP